MPPALLPQITLTCHALPCHPFLIHRLPKNIAAAEHPIPEMVTTAMMLPHHQLRDSPITGQSNHSKKGDIFWLRAVPGTCTVHKKAKLEELGWPDLSLCKGEWSRVLSPTALYTLFISSYSDSFHHDRARGNNRLGSAPCSPSGGCTQPGV